MTDKSLRQRKSPRLQGYDYAQGGAYFVTICTHERLSLSGGIVEGEMYLSGIGEIAAACWETIPLHFPRVELDAFVVMPNHVHGIAVLIAGTGNTVKPASLGTIIANYKAAVTRRARREFPDAPGKLWQGRYHDHIIRDEAGLNRIREYVVTNPARWQADTFYAG